MAPPNFFTLFSMVENRPIYHPERETLFKPELVSLRARGFVHQRTNLAKSPPRDCFRNQAQYHALEV